MAAPTSTTHTPEERDAIVTAICRSISGGAPDTKLLRVREACKREGIDYATLHDWLLASEPLATRYARARTLSAFAWEDHSSEVAANATPETVQVAKLQVDEAHWRAKMASPRTHGDKLDVTTKGESLADLHISALLAPRTQIDAPDTPRISATATPGDAA